MIQSTSVSVLERESAVSNASLLKSDTEYTNGQQIIVANSAGIGTPQLVSPDRNFGARPFAASSRPIRLWLYVYPRIMQLIATMTSALTTPAFRRMSVNGDDTPGPSPIPIKTT
jgi:hypothetical protein